MNEHSLKYDAVSALKKLRKAGVSQGQAEAHVEVISGALENVATKSDLERVEKSLTTKTEQGNKLLLQQMEFMKDEMKSMNNGLNQRIDSMNDNFNQRMDSMDSNFNQRMDSMDENFNQKVEKYFYKLLVLAPAVILTAIALYEYLKDKLG